MNSTSAANAASSAAAAVVRSNEMTKFVLSIINAYDEDADSHLNIYELKKMLTNQTIMRKVEKIYNKRLQSRMNVMHQSTKFIQAESKPSQASLEMANKKNTNLKSAKKQAILSQLKHNQDYDYGE